MRALLLLCCLGLAAPAAAGTVDDPRDWLTAHGVKDADDQLGDACCCAEITVGRPAERALECREAQGGGHPESADIVISEVIRVVHRGKVIKVLEALIGIQNLDLPPRSGPWIELRVAVDRSGRTVTISDPPTEQHYDCKHKHDADEFGAWLDRVCASRGTYRWRGGRFVRAAR